MFSGLLIGGSSCVGKTTLSNLLARRYGAAHIQTDRCLPAESQFRPLDHVEAWKDDPTNLCHRLVEAAALAVPLLIDQISKLAGKGRWIIEGERVHPDLLEYVARSNSLPGVLIIEIDAERLFQTLRRRLPKFETLPRVQQNKVASVNQLYNMWLSEEAVRRENVWVASQPWATLAERVLTAAHIC